MSPFWKEVTSRPRELFARLDGGQKVAVLSLAAVAVAIAVVGGVLASRPSFQLLYGGLATKDASEMVALLDKEGVSYRLGAAGTQIEVASEQVDHARLMLAGSGLPSSGGIGFEIFNKTNLGMTDSLFNLTKQRAWQGELERAIESGGEVRSAKVLLHLPKQHDYLRGQERASASVSIHLRPGGLLSKEQVYAIAHLVSGAGHGMKANDVTIVDSQLNHLWPPGDDDDSRYGAMQARRVAEIERAKELKAESMLAETIGPGKAKVRVSVEIDLTHRESQSETRNDDNRVVVREETRTSKQSGREAARGDPSIAPSPSSGSSGSGDSQEDTTTEYLDGVRQELAVTQPGSIRHMSVSVLLDAGDENLVSKATEIGNAVKAAVGFQEDRDGVADLLVVETIPFLQEEPIEVQNGLLDQLDLNAIIGHLVEAITVLFVLVFLMKLLRRKPADARGRAAGEGQAAVVEEKLDLRQKLTRVIQERPEDARETLLAWLQEEVSG